MKKYLFISFLFFISFHSIAQTNSLLTNPAAHAILKGNYNPNLYVNSLISSPKNELILGLHNQVNKDSLLSYLTQLAAFTTRNTGSDTTSNNIGIGAARRWAYKQFQNFSIANQNRLQVSYFQFDKTICTTQQHKNILAILPGIDTSNKDLVLIEAHIDSRCESVCDSLCLAQGMEDNGSGCALVLELARVFSAYQFNRTLVFLLTIGEEQGLDGSDAFAKYCKANNISIRSVINNDIVGGIICGKTSSPPGCPSENDIDSIHVRLFSSGTNYSVNKGLARFSKLTFEKEMKPLMTVPTTVDIMNAEDRTGRGGDHIPFRQQGYTAMRITSANEHGDANPQAGYVDRQHSSRDILGKDINNDGKIDSFYVNTGYLQRNAWLNGTTLIAAANGPKTPDFDLINDGNGLTVIIKNPSAPNNYLVCMRSRKNDFDTIYKMVNQTDFKTYQIKADSFYFVSVASVGPDGLVSLFALEKYAKIISVPPAGLSSISTINKAFEFLPVSPNPVDETLSFSVWVKEPNPQLLGKIMVYDLQGKLVQQLDIPLSQSINEVVFEHGFQNKGLFQCILLIEGKIMGQQKLFFK